MVPAVKHAFHAQGLLVWAAATAVVLLMPGLSWRGPQAPPFPWFALGPSLIAVAALAVAAPLAVLHAGPALLRWRWLALGEAPPILVWGALALAVWPAAWGPPGLGAWLGAFLLAALPGEIRWLARALPEEDPFPRAWGPEAVRLGRIRTLRALLPPWLAARLPLWITATLVLERMLALPALGSDWLARVALRDRVGLAAWIGAYTLLWLLSVRSPEAR